MRRFGKLAVFQVLVTAKGNAYEFGWIGQIPMPEPWYWRSFADMVPLMDAAPRMSAIPMSEAARRPIDVSPKAANEKVLGGLRRGQGGDACTTLSASRRQES